MPCERRAALRWSLLAALLVATPFLAASAASNEVEQEAGALVADDECVDDSSAQCSLSALQLRGREVTVPDDPGANDSEVVLDKEAEEGKEAGFRDPEDEEPLDSVEPLVSWKPSDGFRHGRRVRVFHQTGHSAGHSILKHGFRPGHVGYCGGGIYFATSPGRTRTKAVGPDSHKGFMIEAVIDLGRTKHIHRHACFSSRLSVHALTGTPTSHFLHKYGVDSFTFNPGDGLEYVISDPRRVVSVRRYR